jgi:CBS domain-containing protein
MKGIEAYFENGEFVTQDVLNISYNMPVKIDIVLPTAELDQVLPAIDEMVSEGLVAVRKLDVHYYKLKKMIIPKHLRVKDIMTSFPETTTASTALSDIVKRLLSSFFSGIPVVDSENYPIGIITQSDLIFKANLPVKLSLLSKVEPDKLDNFITTLDSRIAQEIMSHPVISIEEDELVMEAIDLMTQKNVKRLVVVDSSGCICGILSRMDIFHGITRESPDWNSLKKEKIKLSHYNYVFDIMRRDTFHVKPETSIEEVIYLVDKNDLQCVAVVDQDEKLLGMIFDHDLLDVLSDHGVGLWEHFCSMISPKKKGKSYIKYLEKVQDKTARDVMKTDLIKVLEDSEIDEAISLITTKKIKRLPVISKNGKFKGIINRESLLRAAIKKD